MVEFEEVRRGYRKEQVDEYLRTFTEEYGNLLTELEAATQEVGELKNRYKAIREKNERLEKEKRELEEQNNRLKAADSAAYSDAIASALVTAEMSAKQIITNAQTEARLIGDAATRDLSDIIQVKREALEDIRRMSGRLLGILREESELKAGEEQIPKLLRKKTGSEEKA